ncbi:hypothetical protein BU26DRAFT_185540 [Trematosphaeria pertusa]|uniref:Uncharacterized protein n=1 Tax=Trematosphaeria pertusa TaxID=390896 RepID=A0A6A6HS49_9PLEO|nr:uncharacterized protein BU26DRAFT_185540 [Trematosphaeria pertusa]KAF2240984.1 hypothetical protein BU26DRAFT_185540 [Trematosphaeria pertusa]
MSLMVATYSPMTKILTEPCLALGYARASLYRLHTGRKFSIEAFSGRVTIAWRQRLVDAPRRSQGGALPTLAVARGTFDSRPRPAGLVRNAGTSCSMAVTVTGGLRLHLSAWLFRAPDRRVIGDRPRYLIPVREMHPICLLSTRLARGFASLWGLWRREVEDVID